eukprot:13067615-Alexandrium_andersonii.AAC.1
MSASLVGSEMCIRDRAPPEQRRVQEGGSPVGAQDIAGSPIPRCMNPVSYTHLTLPTICSV